MTRFINEDGDLQKFILNIKKLKETYNGVNIVKEFWAVIKDLNITINLRYFISNNHPSNDIMLKELSKLLSMYKMINI